MGAQQRILLSGFEPFGAFAINPSQQMIRNFDAVLYGVCIEKTVLPVSYTEAPIMLLRLLNKCNWSAVICFGVHGGSGVRIETLGKNRNNSANADNDGLARLGQPVVPEGPDVLPVTLPVRKLLDGLVMAELPASLSDDAGGYLCNHTLYTLLWEFNRRNVMTPAGFIHLPPLPEQSAEAGMPLNLQLRAARIVVETTIKHFGTVKTSSVRVRGRHRKQQTKGILKSKTGVDGRRPLGEI